MISAIGPNGRLGFLLTGSTFNDLGMLATETLAYVWGARQKPGAEAWSGVLCVTAKARARYLPVPAR